MFNACYGLQSTRTGRWLTGDVTPAFAASAETAGAPLYFKPTELGRYLLYSQARTYLDGSAGAARYAARPEHDCELGGHDAAHGEFLFQIPGKGFLTDTASAATLTEHRHTAAAAAAQRLRRLPRGQHQRQRATRSPGVSRIQEVRGYVDAHTHGMAFEFLGGDVHCGRPWYAVRRRPYALRGLPRPLR